MWIMLNDAFLSAVQHRDDDRLVVVRARLKGDLERAFGNRVLTWSNAGTDYAYRTIVSKRHLKRALLDAVDHLDYGNFKSSVLDDERHHAYMDVWTAMVRLQQGGYARRYAALKYQTRLRDDVFEHVRRRPLRDKRGRFTRALDDEDLHDPFELAGFPGSRSRDYDLDELPY